MTRRQRNDRREQSQRANGSWGILHAPLPLITILAATLVPGCGGDRGPERAVVSGTVTHNGKPLADGQIRFVPAADSQVPMSGGPIADGAYHVDGRGGVPVGTHKVAIEGYRTITMPKDIVGPIPPHAKDGLKGQFLPPKYNTQTQLEITIQSGSGQITKNFDLTD